MDSAFLRRLQFVVQFPFPDADGRAKIWRCIFPRAMPVENLDPAKLARLPVTGGTIRNIALSAAFLAAALGEAVQMSICSPPHVPNTPKLEKPLTEADVADWVS